MLISSKDTSSLSNLSSFTSLMIKSKEYEELKARFKSISSRNLLKNSSFDLKSSGSWLKSLETQLKVYENEHKKLSLRITQPQTSEVDLERHVKNLKNKVLVLEKQNERLNSSQRQLPKLPSLVSHNSPRLDLEENLRILRNLKDSVKDLEKKLDDGQKTFKVLSDRGVELTEKLKTLNEELGGYVPAHPDSKFEYLKKKLETINISWKTNVNKDEVRIGELEEELAGLKEKAMHLNAQLFKKTQQMRLLKMSHQEVVMMQDSGKLSMRPDIDHPEVGFMYKPSVKALYNI
jgi:chromosome segregation ATPase